MEAGMAEKFVGKSVKRTEDPRLIQGLARYVDDIKLPDTLHAVFLRSIYAHARIKKILSFYFIIKLTFYKLLFLLCLETYKVRKCLLKRF